MVFAEEKKESFTKINDTAENVFKDFPKQKCTTDNDCEGVFGPIKGKCVKCPEMKMVLGKRIFWGPKDSGFCEQTHMVDMNMTRHPADMKKEGWGSTCHCLAEFQGQEFATIGPKAKEYLDIWKEFVIKSQGISEDYFKKHISLLSAYEVENVYYGTLLLIDYEYTLDWAKVILCDKLLIKKKNVSKYLSKEEIYSIPEVDGGLKDRILLSDACDSMKRIKEINAIVTKKSAKELLHAKCFHDMKETGPSLTREGKLALQGAAVVSDKDNKCKSGAVDLETGQLLECNDTACRLE